MNLPSFDIEAKPQGSKTDSVLLCGKMAARLRLFGNQLKSFWEEQPVIVISVLMGIAGITINYVLLNVEVLLMVECEINVHRVPEAQ